MSDNIYNQSSELKDKSVKGDEIDLKELFAVLWAGKITIILSISVASILAIVIALSSPNIYRAEALLSPVSIDNGGMNGLATKFGGLASLAGVSLGGGGIDKTIMGIEVLQSRKFFADFVDKHPVMLNLMASNGWDSNNNEILIDNEIYDVASQTWVREAKAPRKPEPSVQEAHEEFIDLLFVLKDQKTGFITIAIEHYSPHVAKQWVDWLVQDINNTIRIQEVQQAQRSIDYLLNQVEKTKLAELQVGFFELIQSQTETIMLANANPEYLFKTLDPAVVPELKAKPQRALICILGFLLGAMVGVFIVLVRHFVMFRNEDC